MGSRIPKSLRWIFWLRLHCLLFAPTALWRTCLPLPVAVRKSAEELGPVFIKFGQVLSTRRDWLSPQYADELAKLRDQLPPFASSAAMAMLHEAFRCSPTTLFADFAVQPLAAASVAQVHRARLHSGEAVVVKLIRPGVEKIIARDIALLYQIANWVKFWNKDTAKRLRPHALVSDYEHTIFNELDLRTEAANCAQLRRNFADSTMLYVPQIHWPLVAKRVLVQEFIAGVPIDDIAALRAHGINFRKLAESGVEIFFTQVFRDAFFHADMHPGNILVDVANPQNPRYAGVDFGIMGILSAVDQHYLGMNMLAFFERDYRRIAELHIESGWVARSTRVDYFEQAIRAACEPIYALPMAQISFADLLLQLFRVARHFGVILQPQLLLLQKTLFNIEGLGRQLYPQLDLHTVAAPHLRRWFRQRVNPRRLLAESRRQWLYYLPQIPQLPTHIQRRWQRLETLADDLKVMKAQTIQMEKGARARHRWWRIFAVVTLLLALSLIW